MHKALQIFTAEAAHPFLWAKDRAPYGLIWIGFILQPIKNHIIWRIKRLANLLQNHAAFDFDLILIKHRINQNI